jgi:hypothetical protein
MRQILIAFALTGCTLVSGKKPSDNKAPTGDGFAVVELFTSEGCSSCPPADKLLGTLSSEFPGKVFALGFHVDYWNRLGWMDRFSSAAYTDRQNQYEKFLSQPSAYTPQAVVNGTFEAVGSDQHRLEGLIRMALQNTNTYTLEASLAPGSWTVHYQTNIPSSDQLQVALVEKTAQSDVKAGENKGNTLTHVNVVRAFSTSAITPTGDVKIDAPADLPPADARLFVFAQDPANGHIVKAVEVPLH